MVDVRVPETRASVPESRVRTSRVVSSEEWGSAAELAAWVQGSGGVALPSHAVGLEVSTSTPTTILDTALTDASYGWWREAAVAIAVLVTGHREGAVGGFLAYIDVTASDGVTTLGTWRVSLDNLVARQPRRFELQQLALAERGGEIRLVLTALASTTGLYVDLVQVIEQPRSKLVLDEADSAAQSGSCGPHSPIYDVPHLSVRGAVDAHLYADWRRAGYFHHGGRDNPIAITTTGDSELFPLGLPMQSQVRAPGDTESTDVVVCIDATFDDAGDAQNTASLKVTTDVALGTDTQNVDVGWTTYVFRIAVATEDLDSVDGRRALAWELLRITANLVIKSGVPKLEIGTIGIFGANAEAELGWSASNHLVQPDTVAMPGSDTMTRVAVVRVDSISGTQVIFSKRSGNTGWQLYMTGGGQLALLYGAGATTRTIFSGFVSAGLTYTVAASWDGASLRLVLGQTAAAPVAGAGPLSPAAIAASVGAFATASSPAAGLAILGVAGSDSIALSDVAMQAHNALCAAVGDVRPFAGCEHLYSARFGLHADLVGSADFGLVGAASLERFVPRMG